MSDEARRADERAPGAGIPVLPFGWPAVLQPPARPALERALLAHVTPRRWFRAKNRRARSARVADLVPLPGARDVLALVDIAFDRGADERYLVPLAFLSAADAERAAGHALIARLGEGPAGAALVDGLASGSAAEAFRALVETSGVAPGQAGELVGRAQPALAGAGQGPARVAPLEQTNSTVSFGERILLKLYRQLTPGINPELEMGTFLDGHGPPDALGRQGVRPTPPVLGALSYQARDGAAYGVGIMHAFVPSEGDAWSVVQRELRGVLARPQAAVADAALGRFIGRAATLGRRTAEVHLALASATADDEAFRPEPLTEEDRRLAAGRAQEMLDQQLAALQARLDALSTDARAAAERLLARDGFARRAIDEVFDRFVAEEPGVVKTRIHGDLHLGQVLARGDDFAIIDFEGEPARPLVERRAKSSPLRDVMGMVRSFSYAPEAVLRAGDLGAESDPERRERLVPLGLRWQARATEEFLGGYLNRVRGATGVTPDLAILPRQPGHLRLMLDFYALERVIYEVGYELNNRTDWVDIPLFGLLALVDERQPR